MGDTILVVDDEPGILKVYQDLLSPSPMGDIPRSSRGEAPPVAEFSIPCDLLVADSGEEAERLVAALYARGGCLTSCFMDMRMPGGIDGLETVRRLRSLDPRILVTFVTAYQDRSLMEVGQVFGPQGQDEWDFLNKPFTRAEILQKARNMLASWKRRRENEDLTRVLQEANTRLRKRTEELQAAHDNLLQSEKMAVIGTMAAGVAHELNNPLTAVIGYTHLALRSPDLNKERRQIERAAEQATRASVIVKNLLSFARKGVSEKVHMGLNGIIGKSIELKEYELRVSNLNVRMELDHNLALTMLDFNQMQQVFVNLLTNGEQAMVAAGKTGSLRIATRAVNGRIEAKVSDEGPGIPAEVLSRIFEPFFTTKEVGRGTGLGLSICYGIVQDHGGSIRAENLPEGGACFTIELPVIAPEQKAVACFENEGGEGPAAPADGPIGAAPPRPSMKLLVVDDEQSILDVVSIALMQVGYSVVPACNGVEALREALETPFDLVITDMKMPRMGGGEFSRRLVEQRPEMSGRILFISGDMDSAMAAAAALPQPPPCLAKPFTHIDLLKAIESFFPARTQTALQVETGRA